MQPGDQSPAGHRLRGTGRRTGDQGPQAQGSGAFHRAQGGARGPQIPAHPVRGAPLGNEPRTGGVVRSPAPARGADGFGASHPGEGEDDRPLAPTDRRRPGDVGFRAGLPHRPRPPPTRPARTPLAFSRRVGRTDRPFLLPQLGGCRFRRIAILPSSSATVAELEELRRRLAELEQRIRALESRGR